MQQNTVLNLSYGFILASIILARYMAVAATLNHQLFVRWTNLDLISLISIHVIFWLFCTGIFSFIKNQSFKAISAFLLMAALLSTFIKAITEALNFEPSIINLILLSISIILLLITVLYLIPNLRKKSFFKSTKVFIESNQIRFYQASLATCICFSLLAYYNIATVKDFDIKEDYKKQKPAMTSLNLAGKPKNIFYFIFDRLSYQELYLTNNKLDVLQNYITADEDFAETNPPKVNSKYQNFRNFANNSWNFHSAFSKYSLTRLSIPSILGLDREDHSTKIISDLGYKTNVLGSYINYCDLLDDLDLCKSYTWYKTKSNLNPFLTSLLRHLLYIPISGHKKITIETPFFSNLNKFFTKKRAKKLQESIEYDFFQLIEPKLENAFIYLHMTLPHPPFAFDRNGVKSDKNIYEEVFLGKHKKSNREGYHENLDYLDYFFGRFLDELKIKGLYDDALIIVSSDHSYKGDPEFRNINLDPGARNLLKNKFGLESTEHLSKIPKKIEKASDDPVVKRGKLYRDTHIPLLIKLAKQKSAFDSFDSISNTNLFAKTPGALFNSNLSFDSNDLKNLEFIEPNFRSNFSNESILINPDKLIQYHHH